MEAVTLKAKTMKPEIKKAFLEEYGWFEKPWIETLLEGYDYVAYEGVNQLDYAGWFEEAIEILNITPEQYLHELKASGKFNIFDYCKDGKQAGIVVVMY